MLESQRSESRSGQRVSCKQRSEIDGVPPSPPCTTSLEGRHHRLAPTYFAPEENYRMSQARASIEGIIERTLYIQTLSESGTTFAINYDDQQYLITAKHVVDKVLPGETVRIHSDYGVAVVSPVKIEVSDGDPDKGDVDVAVLQMPRSLPLQSSTPTLGCPEDLFVSQSVAMPTAEYYGTFRTGFVVTTRTGTTAAIVKPEHRSPFTGDLLVGIEAYQGFSGSPVIYWDAEGQARLAGIAARLSWRKTPVFGPEHIHSGLIGCFHIGHALDLVRAMA